MLNQGIIFSEKIFTDQIDQAPTRDGYGKGLVAAGKENPDVVVLCADLSESTRSHWFAEAYPDRFVEVGVAEQNMASLAAGMALAGKIPFVSSYAMFNPGRNWEQIRTTICYNEANVKIAGAHAGVSVGPDGATHQAIEDIALVRSIPNMTVIVPCDALEAEKATVAASRAKGPFYLRFGREKTPVFTTEESLFTLGKVELLWQGERPAVTLIACGSLVYNALLAAKDLEREGIAVDVLNNHTIKPLDEAGILEAVKRSGAAVTIEEHQVSGGMGGAIAELLAKKHPAPVEFIGVQNQFGQSGSPAELIEHYGMGVSAIKDAAKRAIARKR